MARPVRGSSYFMKFRWYGAYGQRNNLVPRVYAWWRKLP